MLRTISFVGAVALGLGAFGQASAQPYPAQPYPTASGSYGSAPASADDDYAERGYPSDPSGPYAQPDPYGQPAPEPRYQVRQDSSQQDWFYARRHEQRLRPQHVEPQQEYRPQHAEPPQEYRPPHDVGAGRGSARVAALPPEQDPDDAAVAGRRELDPRFKKQMVDYPTREPAGSVIVDTANTYLYLVMGNGKAIRYGIGVGREGFTWAGRERISRMREWPDWHPPAEMIERQPFLPRFMAGGPGNPMGARALYLGKTIYRIHGTNEPHTIGKFVSSGCIRMLNEDVEDLYQRVSVGAQVVVLPGRAPAAAQMSTPQSAPQSAPQGAPRSPQVSSPQPLTPPAPVGPQASYGQPRQR